MPTLIARRSLQWAIWRARLRKPRPGREVTIHVAPGSYTGPVRLPPWVNLRAVPHTVTVTGTRWWSRALGVLDVRNGNVTVSGITWSMPPRARPARAKYPCHHTARGFSRFVDCHFVMGDHNARGVPSALGADCDSGSTTIFDRCEFVALVDGGAATNVHGWEHNTAPVEVAYLGCSSNGELTFHGLGSGQPDVVRLDATTAPVYASR